MKKLIAIAVVFALAAGGVFAADIGATVFGGVRLMAGSTAENTNIGYDAGMTRARFEGSGENDDGNFGAWMRFDAGLYAGATLDFAASALAWWKPIDQFKLAIGGNPDGIYGKEGYAGWMFYQMPSDCGVVDPGSVWGGGYLNPNWSSPDDLGYTPAKYRNAFYEGVGSNALMLEIKPVDMFGLNIVLPYFDWFGGSDTEKSGKSVGGVFKRMTIQADINLDFGNIALTFDLDPYTKDDKPDGAIGGKAYLYFGLSAIDNLSLDIGIGFPLPQSYDGYKYQAPIAAGVAAKFDVNDSFGFKARLLAQFGESVKPDSGDPDKGPFILAVDLLPYIAINDSMKAFIGLGLTMHSFPEVDLGPLGKVKPDSVIGFHFNPYLQIGAEWGPTFYAGIRVYSYGDKSVDDAGKDVSAPIHFEIPIGIQVSF